MPLLKGGIKHRKGIEPRGTVVTSVKKKKMFGIFNRKLGKGQEGKVFEVEVIMGKNGNEKKLTMAQKEFYENSPFAEYYGIENNFEWVIKQFKMMNELIELNKRKKLRLRIPNTIRLVEEKGKKAKLIMTRLKLSNFNNLTKQQTLEFNDDKERQCGILLNEGYDYQIDAFEPMIDKKTGKCVAMIADLGNIFKKEKRR